ncbi:hypothetical protein HPB51_024766 [Rhipicephalus microplus]|uniref:Uncharacterized protein n=1 Tax=Rhipicephalus microplus TaxID=6941 RepID=A0A9J6D7R7_RHIMP|nr:hypothetical protein HPB51_024766 [Rhipicephalus microplus]
MRSRFQGCQEQPSSQRSGDLAQLTDERGDEESYHHVIAIVRFVQFCAPRGDLLVTGITNVDPGAPGTSGPPLLDPVLGTQVRGLHVPAAAVDTGASQGRSISARLVSLYERFGVLHQRSGHQQLVSPLLEPEEALRQARSYAHEVTSYSDYLRRVNRFRRQEVPQASYRVGQARRLWVFFVFAMQRQFEMCREAITVNLECRVAGAELNAARQPMKKPAQATDCLRLQWERVPTATISGPHFTGYDQSARDWNAACDCTHPLCGHRPILQRLQGVTLCEQQVWEPRLRLMQRLRAVVQPECRLLVLQASSSSNREAASSETHPDMPLSLASLLARLETSLQSLSSVAFTTAVARDQIHQVRLRITEISERLANVSGYRARLTSLRDQIVEGVTEKTT